MFDNTVLSVICSQRIMWQLCSSECCKSRLHLRQHRSRVPSDSFLFWFVTLRTISNLLVHMWLLSSSPWNSLSQACSANRVAFTTRKSYPKAYLIIQTFFPISDSPEHSRIPNEFHQFHWCQGVPLGRQAFIISPLIASAPHYYLMIPNLKTVRRASRYVDLVAWIMLSIVAGQKLV